MNEILTQLTPPEIYIWVYLSELEIDQGRKVITLPRSGPGKLYTRQHLKRILKSLQAKKYLVIVASPLNQHQELMVALGSRPRLNIYVQASRQENSGRASGGSSSPSGRTEKFRQHAEEFAGNPGACAGRPRDDVQAAPQLSLSSKDAKDLKALAEKGQEELMATIMKLTAADLEELEKKVYGIAPWARGKKASKKAKLYAAIRFLQDGHQKARSKQAWVEGVAKRAHNQMEQIQWSGSEPERSSGARVANMRAGRTCAK